MLATLRRIWNLILKELTHLKRDRLLAPFVILGPLSELIAVAYVSSVGIENLPLVVVDGSRTDASRALVQAIEHTGVFAAPLFLDDVQAALPLMESGAVVAVVVIPPDFQEALLRPDRPATVQMLVDGSEPPAAQTALDAVQGVVAAYGARLLLESGARASPEAAPVWARLRVWFNEELKQSNYEIPSELGFMLSGVTIMVASLGIAREREMGTLEQLLVTP
ncbi:MAG: ABC transporter permease, partial [Anaerolineae bacterium]|nr:ABC transporter permease [Anaerolineae bacterium]